MDDYTLKTKNWLEERYRKHDSNGIYYAHQPIYGFRRGHSEDHPVLRYSCTYEIMQSLSHIRFSTLLDVGGSEGYKAALAERIFGITGHSSDLSEEACKRATEIFGVKSTAADIHDLRFGDGEFDVVLCSETLEHTANPRKALDELLRVAACAVVITVPHDKPESVERNVGKGVPHGHINSFNLDSFNYLKARGLEVIGRRISSPLLIVPGFLAEAQEVRGASLYKHPILYRGYNSCVPVLSKVFGEAVGRGASNLLVGMDGFACRLTRAHNTCIFTVLKDGKCWSDKPLRKVNPSEVIDFRVPYHYILS